MKVMLVFGTRPEAIKMAPLVRKLLENYDFFTTSVCVTGQHRQMLDQVLTLFDIKPDFDLNIMHTGQDLYDITSRVLMGMRDVLRDFEPDVILVHGDTTTSTAAALAAYYSRITVAHVEAGLRTGNIYSPFPEEMNRSLTGRLATWHFAPTLQSRNNLLHEGVDQDRILVTGNTVIDALHWVVNKFDSSAEAEADAIEAIKRGGYDVSRLRDGRRLLLMTGHRRENFGAGFRNICLALKDLTLKFKNVDFVYPMHLNPNVRSAIFYIFGGGHEPNMFFMEPLEYLPFVWMMRHAHIVLTDSGGIQEEAPGLGKPTLVMRETTERPEAVEAGTVRLVGTDRAKISEEVTRLLCDKAAYETMARADNPYGDGRAVDRIADFLRRRVSSQ